MLLCTCLTCSKIFLTKKSHIKIGWGKYCSQPCSYQSKKTGSFFACGICKKELYRNKLEITRSKSGRFFCNKSCFAVWKNSHILLGEKHVSWKGGIHSYRQSMLRNKITPFCADCGITNLKVLVTHHIDQNRKNNKISNLKWLCRNCHYLEHKGKTL